MISDRGHNLVFLLGVPRSGTTLLGALLSNQPGVMCPPEPWLMLALHALGKTNPRHPADSQLLGEASRQFLDHDAFIAAARACATNAYNAKLQDAQRSVFVDKTPRYHMILPFVAEVFPDAKFIWLRRSPFDVVNSYKTSWGVDVPKLLENGAGTPFEHDIVLGLRNLNAFANERHDRVLSLSYERLVADPGPVMASVAAFLGIDAADSSLEIDSAIESLRGSSLGDRKILATKGVHNQSVGAGLKLLEAHELQTVYDAIGPKLLTELGYEDQIVPLHELGVHDPPPEVTCAHERRARASQDARWQLLDVWSAVEMDLPKGALQQEILDRHRAQVESLTNQITSLNGLLQIKDAALAERDAHIQAVLDNRKQLRDDFENYRKQIETRTFTRHSKEAVKALIKRVVNRITRAPRVLPLPKITIVTPVFNGEAHIRETIESVLSQNYPNLEYIVVDGGSTDGTMKIVREYESQLAHIISEPDNGMYDAVAKGFDLATGDVLGYINADDVFEPGGLLHVGEYFRDHPKAYVAYREDTINVQGWRFPNAFQPHVDLFDMLRGHILFQDGVHFRREAYVAVGGMSRTLRLAGDYDLWLRLARYFKLHRAPGHVSSFRIRAGQLSGNMPPYWAEQKIAQAEVRKTLRWFNYVRRLPRYLLKRALRLWEKLRGPRRLFYPMNFHGPLTPGKAPDPNAAPPRCPLTGRPPTRLLFTSRDTRFGDPLINHIYYCDESQLAVVWPPLSEDELTALYEKHYSGGGADIIWPADGMTSPYRHYRQPGRWRRPFNRLRWPKVVERVINRPEKLDWNQVCMQDLRKVLGGRFDVNDTSVRMLDVGCFEAGLLDTVRTQTKWQTCGLEPNAAAVKVARDKGHNVWRCGAEDAVFAVPDGQQFDIIYLGQTIEHFNDPLRVVRRLRTLLSAKGVMVIATPNLDSRQVDLYGPTWAHWHVPYHRVLFGRHSLRRLGELAGLRQRTCKSFSHSFWTAYSVQLNQLGIGGAVSHMWSPSAEVLRVSRNIVAWSRLLWNWRGRGDYIVAVFEAARGKS